MIRFQGSEYDFDLDNVGIIELREIKRKLKLTGRGLFEGIQELDPDALTAVYWLTLRSDGKHDDLVLSDTLDFPALEFANAWATSMTEAKEEEGEADPTPDGSLPDTTTPALTGSSTGTSESSAASTSSRSPGSAGSPRPKSTG